MTTNSNNNTLLIELGTEELPPKNLKTLSNAFFKEIVDGLLQEQLISQADAGQARPYATPRRLAVSVPNVIQAQPDQVIERRGPAVQAAFKEGQPTPAAMGFAKSCGVEVEQLERLVTEQGEWLSYNLQQQGKSSADLVPQIIQQAIKRLPIAKRMRWGAGSAEFVRPVHWLLVLHGDQVIPSTVLDLTAGKLTKGHRFHSSGQIEITHADDYANSLQEQGSVIAGFAERQAVISQQITDLAASIGGKVEPDAALLDEVTGLVELPNAILGGFDEAFLQVPQECLISSMRDHQKYFHVVDAQGKLLPNFITVSNINSKNPDQVKTGNERVLRARLADAQFFWQTDQKQPLADRVEGLGSVLFHAKLGSVLDKTKRLQVLAGDIASQLSADKAIAERGALLCKADLVSNMVGEFDELQGIMGHYYADFDGEPALVGDCVEQHYWPKFSGDQLPVSAEAQAVALADKLDSLVGIYAAGEIPTGDKDPYALRRAAVSILRILIEREQVLNLSDLVASSAKVYQQNQNMQIDADTQQQIVRFIQGRLSAYYQTQAQQISTSTINAVLACQPDSPLDFHHRLLAVNEFTQLSESVDLAAANKRIGNILKKQKQAIKPEVDQALMHEAAELELFKSIEQIKQDCLSLFAQGDYAAGLQKLASLRNPVDGFFEHVMVMCDDPEQQQNRLALLQDMQNLFLQVADISLLQH